MIGAKALATFFSLAPLACTAGVAFIAEVTLLSSAKAMLHFFVANLCLFHKPAPFFASDLRCSTLWALLLLGLDRQLVVDRNDDHGKGRSSIVAHRGQRGTELVPA